MVTVMKQPAPDKQLQHEAAAHEKRKWIRLTSMCNNKCTFCLDTLAHNETIGEDETIKAQIIAGRREGATRLILSGGEPTIHPNFVKFVKYGQLAGYRRVQTVTNGRMFSYPDFLKRSLDAGLGEITFSIHGHNAKVHDALVGVKGAFDEEVTGLKAALADGRPIVNIDVCLNKGNITKLPQLLDRFMTLGVREFDLLHLIPFGNAWEMKHRQSLMYDIDEAMPFIQEALKLSEQPDVHIWFNRFPAPYLEGYEHLIQDPYKLNDEARGRFEEYELWLTRNLPLSCRDEERCNRCYLQHFCDSLEHTLEQVADDRFDAYRVDIRRDPSPAKAPADYPVLWLAGPDLPGVESVLTTHPAKRVVLELDTYPETLDLPGLERVVTDSPVQATALLAGEGTFEVMVLLNETTAPWLERDLPTGHVRLAVGLANQNLASDVPSVDLAAFFKRWAADVPVENVPECVLGRAPRPRLTALDSFVLRSESVDYSAPNPGDTGGRGSLLNMLDDIAVGDPAKLRDLRPTLARAARMPLVEKGVLDLFGYARHYIEDHYYTKSVRCAGCRVNPTCAGMHINAVRTHGYGPMQPLAPQDDASLGTDSTLA
jgi:MoaA/NifB/PqqE/SkfB family radical SAM enzyme